MIWKIDWKIELTSWNELKNIVYFWQLSDQCLVVYWWTHPTAHTSVAAYAGRGVGQGGQLAVAGTGTSLATTSKPGGHLVICLDLAGNIRQWHNIDGLLTFVTCFMTSSWTFVMFNESDESVTWWSSVMWRHLSSSVAGTGGIVITNTWWLFRYVSHWSLSLYNIRLGAKRVAWWYAPVIVNGQALKQSSDFDYV